MVKPPLFQDRQDAGTKLAQAILAQAPQPPLIVYGLPRGGLPIALPVARHLGCPLDIMVAKKITRPEDPELALGAVTAEGHVLWTEQLPRCGPQREILRTALSEAQQKAQAQRQQLVGAQSITVAPGTTAILVDDGIATGMTMAAAAQGLRDRHPKEIWICAPVAPASLIPWLQQWAERLIILETPEPFYSVSRFYQEFPQVEMSEALARLQASP